ncbi:TRAP transporter small permease [Roseibium sp.]|uniref:TRAP transporter small permease n=1 Tax=Roseibium sp. TaxID=1936156 RepID=UPI003D11CD58
MALNTLYRASTALAACCLVVIASLVVLQVLARLADGTMMLFGLEPFGLLVPSLAEIAGFLLVGASFLALAGTFRNADHIRVSILLQAVPSQFERLLNIWCVAIALALVAFFTWNAGALAYDSYKFNEVSFGIIPIPLVIPQMVMTLGLSVFSVALLDDLVLAVSGKAQSFEIVSKEDPIEGKE